MQSEMVAERAPGMESTLQTASGMLLESTSIRNVCFKDIHNVSLAPHSFCLLVSFEIDVIACQEEC